MSRPDSFNLVVLGAGPSGSSLALAMARRGWRVAVLEKTKMPRDKVCGGFIGPANSEFLDELGLTERMRQEGFPVLTHLLMSAPSDRSAKIPILLNGAETTAWGVWRREFDSLLLEEARKAGVTVFEEVKNTSAGHDGMRGFGFTLKDGTQRQIEAGIVVDARGVDPTQTRGPCHAMGLAAEFENSNVPGSLVSVHYARDGHCGIDPIGKGRVTVGYVADPALFERGGRDPDVILGLFRKENACLDRLMGSARQITPWKGTKIHLVQKFRFFENGMFCVGDAVGNVNPVGGIGLTFALQSARMLASLLTRHSPAGVPVPEVAASYERLWRRELLGRLRMSRTLGWWSHWPPAAGLMMSLFRAFPGILRAAFQKQHAPVHLDLNSQAASSRSVRKVHRLL